jgi:protein SCO1
LRKQRHENSLLATANIISATLTLIASLLLTGCFGNDEEDWNGKNISGLMPELEFDLINSQGKSVSGDDYSGRVRMLFFGFTSCPDVCPTALQKLNQVTSGLDPELQDEVLTLFVSVDPKRDTPERLAKYVDFFGCSGLMNPDTNIGGKVTTLIEVPDDQKTTFLYS